MPKNKLIINYNFDFELFGIISTIKEYKLAWLINKHLGFHLVKEKDIIHEFINLDNLIISNYLDEAENVSFRLLKNKSENKNSDKIGYLIPELFKFDFFIMKNGEIGGKGDKDVLSHLQGIREIQYVTSLDIKKLKSKENLIF